ncbi:MAG: helix-turn-helix domain-containing protein [Bacilli bacterium]
MTYYNGISDTLIELRKKRGVTQKELGKVLGVSNKTVSKWEKGTIEPDIASMINISTYYGITIDQLVKGIEKEKLDKIQFPLYTTIYARKVVFLDQLFHIIFLILFLAINFEVVFVDSTLSFWNMCFVVCLLITYIFSIIGHKAANKRMGLR